MMDWFFVLHTSIYYLLVQIKTAMKHALDKLEVVDRAEFDVQSEALSKALAHVKELEKEITELKSKIESLASSDKEL